MEQSKRGAGLAGILAVVGGALLVKKFAKRRAIMRHTLAEYGINGHNPLAIADQVRAMDQEKYEHLKEKLEQQFNRSRCRH